MTFSSFVICLLILPLPKTTSRITYILCMTIQTDFMRHTENNGFIFDKSTKSFLLEGVLRLQPQSQPSFLPILIVED
ncbi:MAG: hypothetical protein M2R45_00541 [Verrucomicrobia subdivision 3 bacterium]|nr:hypothetical protein [Limisphaerales bacterium]MCS1413581.1 hypothetical protein [Limisphaerales bacterium]